ncbi:MAG: succinate dehydrogenase, hydrophobic membrane anchor protein [Xanthomonadaceae bacterium]|nr:succinate dehydrogenase, hydrophobic membrane anchor protein [Xanthomonadaceae bacterium]MDP2185729.1 succinate dehydrogenase, hydrophobic membrane anchor protein [Xanthomonadales bacterium]MDZ4115012.1 succinate dehydrogenase, hydrophobic membrane anchor protein [Xanthomonadaceae bacterium]MDZ4378078.1 succinate dehydrogenase, hydrophobic membrane anchor protein [Xanthomonadaceae bacterium]
MSMRTPVGRARGLGSAKEGVAHWTAQRLSAVALALLTPWFVWLAIGLVGADQALAAARLGEPVNATLMLAYVGALLWHGQLGLQVVIEDYVGNRGLELFAQVAVKLVFALAGVAALVAIGRLAFA